VTPLRKYTVALVSADPVLQATLTSLLTGDDISIVGLGGAQQALEALGQSPAQLVIAGLSAPGLEAWELCRRMRAADNPALRQTPILVVSAELAGEVPARITADLGGNAFASLPDDRDRFPALVRDLLAGEAPPSPAAEACEERFRAAVRDAGAGYFLIDTDGLFRWVNDAWLLLHGYSSASEVIGRHYSLTQVPGDLDKAADLLGQLLSGVAMPAGEFTRRCKDGSVGYHTFSAHPVMDAGRVVGIEGFLIDTTPLHHLEERYRMLFERMLGGFALHEMIFDAEGKPADYRFLAVNPAFERMTGLSAAAIVGRTVSEVLPGTEPHWIENYGRVVLTGEPYRFESSHAGLGKVFEVVAFRPQEGQFACIFRDVTESRQLEARSRLLAHALRSADDCVCITDATNHILYVNDAFLRTYGYQEHELLGQDIILLVVSPRTNMVEQKQILPATIGGGWRGELWNRAKDGREFPISLATSVVRDDNGEAIALIGVARDITEQRRAEDALRESELWLRESQSISRVGSYVLDIHSGFWESSAVLDEIFGIGPDFRRDVDGWKQLIHPDFQTGMVEYLQNEVVAQGKPFDREYRIVRASDGQARWVHGRGSLTFGPDGRPARMVGTIQDITGRKQAEEERARLEEQLRESRKLESLGRLAGGVAHDFNNHLTVISGYCDMILGRLEPDDRLRREMEAIRAAAGRAAGLTGQLLAFSRKQIVEPKAISLNDVVRDAGHMLRRLIGEDIEVVTTLDPGLRIVTADRGQMNQVLVNLAINARDAMPEGGRLTIETSNEDLDESGLANHPDARPGRYAVLCVADTGIGMDAATMQNIFEPFFTTKKLGAGTGLGLATVYGIVRQNGGWLSVTSRPGAGSTFRIYLPKVDAVPEPVVTSEADLAGSRGSETVLVVEDQEEVRKLVLAILDRNGYRLLEAPNGPEALALCGLYPEPIHLLVTDVVMPGMTGRELADRLLEVRPDLKVLYTSGYTADVIGRQGVLDAGVSFLQKPFTGPQLSAKVREVLGIPNRTILVIDDDPEVRGLVGQILMAAGYEVLSAADGKAGIRSVEENEVRLVITDLVMPNQEGLETIGQLRARRPGIKIVAISGAYGGAFLKAARLFGAHAALGKPLEPGELLRVVRELLAG